VAFFDFGGWRWTAVDFGLIAKAIFVVVQETSVGSEPTLTNASTDANIRLALSELNKSI